MQIGEKEYKEIIITDNEGGLICDITDDSVIADLNAHVELIGKERGEHND